MHRCDTGCWYSTIVLHDGLYPARIVMSTTTIRLDDDLKARVTAAAKRAGKTAHAFILEAIAQTVEQGEMDEAFHRIADKRWAKVLATGKTVSWDDAKSWIEARSRGGRAVKPKPRKPGHERPHGPRRTRT